MNKSPNRDWEDRYTTFDKNADHDPYMVKVPHQGGHVYVGRFATRAAARAARDNVMSGARSIFSYRKK